MPGACSSRSCWVWQYWKGGKRAYPEPMVTPEYGPGAGRWGPISNCGAVSDGPFGWATTYITYGVGAAAQRLYDNDQGILTRYQEFWAMMAKRFRANPAVLGYELLNEVRCEVIVARLSWLAVSQLQL